MTSTLLATTPTAGIDEDPLLLYEPIHQQVNAKKIPWTISYEKVTPQQAQVWLSEATEYQKFGQRPRTPARIKRWLDLMETNRYAEYNPLAPLCFNEDGIVMNGGNRLAAVSKMHKPVGFMVVRNCPTWMLPYFDNGATRSNRDAAIIHLRDPRPDAQAIIKLGLRYEEFLFGKRGEYGWADWSKHRGDEHNDLNNFDEKREELLDLLARGQELRKATVNLQVSSGACFIFYQQLAWPEGTDKLEQFLDGLLLGVMLDKGDPALVLREWARTDGYIGEGTRGRREGHLLLLFRHFLMFVEGQKVPKNKVTVARGLPMSMPYHPKGWEVACDNVRQALKEMG